MLGFGYTLLETPDKIQRFITGNRRLQQTKFYVGKTPAVTLAKTGNTFVANGFLPKHTQLRIQRATIAASNRMRLIEVKAVGRSCWLPLNKIGVKAINISFRRTNDTFIDSLNADIQHFQRNGVYPKLYVDSISPANLIFENTTKGSVIKNKNAACGYFIEGFSGDFSGILNSFYIRVIEEGINIPTNDKYLPSIITYLTHFTDKDKNLTTNVAYIFPNGADYGIPLYGKGYTGKTGSGSIDCADVVFYGAPAVDTDEGTGSIILKPSNLTTTTSISHVLRRGTQPPADTFCYLASIKLGKNITRPKRIKNAIIQMTFSRHVENNPNVIKKGATIGPVPPGAAGGV
jgi:hypothetical protein